jgi:hypothetical protein
VSLLICKAARLLRAVGKPSPEQFRDPVSFLLIHRRVQRLPQQLQELRSSFGSRYGCAYLRVAHDPGQGQRTGAGPKRFGPSAEFFRRSNGERVLRFSRGKTRVIVEIEIVGELAKIIDECLAASVVRSTFVHREDGERYTTDGLTSMFRRHCIAAEVSDFGLRDLRAKGATDMVRNGKDIRHVQHLLGHGSVRTTEIYIKGLLPTTVRANETPIIASVK